MLGIILAIAAAALFGTSSTLQKYAISKMSDKFSFKKMLVNLRWLAATGIGLAGIAAYVFSMRYAPLSTVQVFLALSIVIPVIAGFVFFKEKLSKREWICVVLILAGILLTALY